jgi:hypothetical protein
VRRAGQRTQLQRQQPPAHGCDEEQLPKRGRTNSSGLPDGIFAHQKALVYKHTKKHILSAGILCTFLKKLTPPALAAGYDLTTQNSAGRNDTIRPRRQGVRHTCILSTTKESYQNHLSTYLPSK